MNSRTSRPRSPTIAITIASAAVPRANIPSSVLLPTPDPAKMPSLCPRPTVSNESIARTPVAMASLIGGRDSESGAGRSTATGINPRGSGLPSIGRPSASTTRPASAGPTITRSDSATNVTGSPAEKAVAPLSGAIIGRTPLNPITLASQTVPSASEISQIEPIAAVIPSTTTFPPITAETRPRTVSGEVTAIERFSDWQSGKVGVLSIFQQFLQTTQLCFECCDDFATDLSHDDSRARHRFIGHDRRVLGQTGVTQQFVQRLA
jgi:hypothetical protein